MAIRLVLGIGNPGKKYVGTRHNIGFEVIFELAKRYDVTLEAMRFRSHFASPRNGNNMLVLLTPFTYVNHTGIAAKAALDFYQESPESLLVISDDINLEPGKVRIKRTGSSGGHNGFKSLIEHLHSTRFPRLRIGVGRGKGSDIVSFVLGRYRGEEKDMIHQAVCRGVDAVEVWLDKGIEESMNVFN